MPLEQHVRAFREEAETLAALDVGALWSRLRDSFLDEAVRLQRNPALDADQLESELLAFIESLSDEYEKDLARTAAGVSYNQGRNAEILSQREAGAVKFVVRSELLDANTCSECQKYDSAIFEVGTRDYHEFMPPNKCLGRDRCRGFYVAVPANIEGG